MGIGNIGLPGIMLFIVLILIIVLVVKLSGRKSKSDQARIADALERIAENQKTDDEKR